MNKRLGIGAVIAALISTEQGRPAEVREALGQAAKLLGLWAF